MKTDITTLREMAGLPPRSAPRTDIFTFSVDNNDIHSIVERVYGIQVAARKALPLFVMTGFDDSMVFVSKAPFTAQEAELSSARSRG